MRLLYIVGAAIAGIGGYFIYTDSALLAQPRSVWALRSLPANIDRPDIHFDRIDRSDPGNPAAHYTIDGAPLALPQMYLGDPSCALTDACTRKFRNAVTMAEVDSQIAQAITTTFATCGLPLLAIQSVGAWENRPDDDPLGWERMTARAIEDGRDWALAAEIYVDLDAVAPSRATFDANVNTCLTTLLTDDNSFWENPAKALINMRMLHPDPTIVMSSNPTWAEWADYIGKQNHAQRLDITTEQDFTVTVDSFAANQLRGFFLLDDDGMLSPRNLIRVEIANWLRGSGWAAQGDTLSDDIFPLSEARAVGDDPDTWRMLFSISTNDGGPADIALTYNRTTGAVSDIVMVHPWGDPRANDGPHWLDDGSLFLP